MDSVISEFQPVEPDKCDREVLAPAFRTNFSNLAWEKCTLAEAKTSLGRNAPGIGSY